MTVHVPLLKNAMLKCLFVISLTELTVLEARENLIKYLPV